MLVLAQQMNASERHFTLSFIMLLLLSSIVIADPGLDLPDNFDNLNVDLIFNREKELRAPKEEEIKWRQNQEVHKSDTQVRWGSTSIYENTVNPDPFFTNEGHPDNVSNSPEVSKQLEIRF